MRTSTLDISGITTTVRRHEALLRYARYMFIYNLVIFVWVAVPQLSQVTSFRGVLELVASPAWQWSALVLGSVGATYLILAHRLWWAYAVIFLAQAGYFFMPSPDKQIFLVSVIMPYGVITQPLMRPLGPLATELAIMTIGFCYMMIVYCLYSATWAARGGRIPRGAYGRRPSPFEPLRPSRLLDTLLPGHPSQNVTLWEAALFALSSMLFVAASMAPFYGFRRVQSAFTVFASQAQQACMREGLPGQPAEATIACWAGFYPWSRVAVDLGAPILSPLSASSSRTACATSAGNTLSIDLPSSRYHRPDRPSSCARFATTRCAYVAQAGTCSHLYSISAACLPPSTN